VQETEQGGRGLISLGWPPADVTGKGNSEERGNRIVSHETLVKVVWWGILKGAG